MKNRTVIPWLVVWSVCSWGGTLSAAELTEEDAPTRDWAVEGLGGEQCEKAVEDRAGAWTCPPATEAEQRELALAARRGASQANAAEEVNALAADYCTVAGCWDKVSDTRVEFSGGGVYGYGKTPLGTTRIFIRINMSGAQSVSKPVWIESTRGMKGATIEGERLYLSSAHPEGKGVNDGKSWAPFGPKNVAANARFEWLDNGYKSYEPTTAWASIVHGFVWKDVSSAYPGRWYFYVKSIKLKRQKSGAYYFTSDKDLPKNPQAAGWKND